MHTHTQSAIFNFQSLLVVILLLICTCTYFRSMFPRVIDTYKNGYADISIQCMEFNSLTTIGYLLEVFIRL